MPEPGQEETVRIVALDRSFHVNCYVCEVTTLLNLICSVFLLTEQMKVLKNDISKY